MTNDGSIWDQDDKVVMKVGETTYNVLKQDKTNEKQPDWKGDDVAIWDKISQKGNTYRFIKIGEEDYVAFMNKNKAGDNPADWVVKKSEPLKQ